jgi:hypothetical protein
MTLGVELPVPKATDCVAAARRFVERTSRDAEARAAWLVSEAGPLSPALTRVSPSARVVVNVQLVRWPSTIRPDLGGHAEYLLRSFRADSQGVLRSERLENTPDPARLRGSGRRELDAWLSEQSRVIDQGTPLLPESLLATRAVSITPRGLHRLANRPFSLGIEAQTLAGRDFAGGSVVKSAAGLLRRLDQLSCPGCHQARSVAGFHLLGEDPASAPAENALAVAVSPQVTEDLPRRLRIARQLLEGREPDLRAPLPERSNPAGGYGQPCSLGSDPSFESWTCPSGLVCSSIEARPGDPIGQCLAAAPEVGDACERASVTPSPNPHRDRATRATLEDCPRMLCNRSSVGFPGGMCTASCGASGSACGSIAVLDSFNACLARGESFLSCIRGNVSPAGLRSCSAEAPCRDDYVCARAAQGGVCLPPYFVFQLRVDGHSSGLR